MSATTDADYKKEYTTFIQGLSSEFVKIYPSDSAKPKYIIETRATNGDELSRVSTFLEWSQKDQTPVPNDLLSGFVKNWGGIRSVSPSGKYLLCIRNVKEINGFEVGIIESESYKEVCQVRFEGYSAASGLFSGIAWDREERNIAMACSPKSLPFTYDTPWLSNTSVVDMIPCVINLAKGDSFFLDNLPPCYSYGQPVWCSESLLCMIGWHKTPVHESMDSFCTLPSSLLFYDLNTHTTDLLNLECNPQLVRFNTGKNQLIVLGPHRSVLSHNSSLQIIAIDVQSKTWKLLVDHQETPREDGYAGIFFSSLPDQPFSSDGSYPLVFLFVNCIQGAKCVCYSINTSIPNVISWNNSPFSFTEYIGEVWGRKAYRLSAPDCPPCLALYENGGFCQVYETELRPIQSGVYSSLLRWNVMKSKDQNGCEMILYEPSNEKSDSLIVLLHGGPHNCFAACYTPDILFYVHQKYTVLVPNYHGSFGAGDAFLHSLCGHIGDIEIHDVLDSIETALRERPSLSHDSLYLMGSSYGGFIGMKLLQARPTLFRYAILRNGVFDTVTMLTASDMPSWMLVLAGIIPSRGETTEKARMVLRGQYVYSLEDLQRVYTVNPIREMEKVETPICFILGGKDCRVVNQQTFEAYRLLKSFGRDVEIVMNENDNHMLRSVCSTILTCIQVQKRFRKNDNCRIRTCAGKAQQISSLSP